MLLLRKVFVILQAEIPQKGYKYMKIINYCTDSQGIVISATSQKEAGLGQKTICDIKPKTLGETSQNEKKTIEEVLKNEELVKEKKIKMETENLYEKFLTTDLSNIDAKIIKELNDSDLN